MQHHQPHDLAAILDIKAIAHNFSNAAKSYDAHACFQQEAALRLTDRLDWFKCTPNRILDIGSGTGLLTALLKKRYPKAQIVGLDLAIGMTRYAESKFKPKFWAPKHYHFVCGNAHQLPLRPHQFDLVVSNCALQWCQPLSVFKEIKKAIKPNGLFLFTTLGPDTLYELKNSFRGIDNYEHVHPFVDMHDIGDLLLNAGFNDPVMDAERLTLTYPNIKDLCLELKHTGATNIHQARSSGLMSRSKWQQLKQQYDKFLTTDKQYPATFEIIYGHAFHPVGITTPILTQCEK
ncbi:MAG: malonyl-ACP O-methyltransferase BioC [Gammaproteobacteria bacterium]